METFEPKHFEWDQWRFPLDPRKLCSMLLHVADLYVTRQNATHSRSVGHGTKTCSEIGAGHVSNEFIHTASHVQLILPVLWGMLFFLPIINNYNPEEI